jgi:predicted metal-binding protein
MAKFNFKFDEGEFDKHLDALRDAIRKAQEHMMEDDKDNFNGMFDHGTRFHNEFFTGNSNSKQRSGKTFFNEACRYAARDAYGMDWGPIERDDSNYSWRVHIKAAMGTN